METAFFGQCESKRIFDATREAGVTCFHFDFLEIADQSPDIIPSRKEAFPYISIALASGLEKIETQEALDAIAAGFGSIADMIEAYYIFVMRVAKFVEFAVEPTLAHLGKALPARDLVTDCPVIPVYHPALGAHRFTEMVERHPRVAVYGTEDPYKHLTEARSLLCSIHALGIRPEEVQLIADLRSCEVLSCVNPMKNKQVFNYSGGQLSRMDLTSGHALREACEAIGVEENALLADVDYFTDRNGRDRSRWETINTLCSRAVIDHIRALPSGVNYWSKRLPSAKVVNKMSQSTVEEWGDVFAKNINPFGLKEFLCWLACFHNNDAVTAIRDYPQFAKNYREVFGTVPSSISTPETFRTARKVICGAVLPIKEPPKIHLENDFGVLEEVIGRGGMPEFARPRVKPVFGT